MGANSGNTGKAGSIWNRPGLAFPKKSWVAAQFADVQLHITVWKWQSFASFFLTNKAPIQGLKAEPSTHNNLFIVLAALCFSL